MLPDFVKLKELIKEDFDFRIKEQSRELDPLIRDIKHVRKYEGEKIIITSYDGYKNENQYTEIKEDVNVKVADIIDIGVKAYTDKIDEIASGIARSQKQMIFSDIQKTTERTGNIVKDEGGLSPEGFIEAIEKVSITFNDKGEPNMPQLHVHPDVYEKIVANEEWNNPKYQERVKAIMAKKKEQWLESENNRKLVD